MIKNARKIVCQFQYPGTEDESTGIYERRIFSAMVTGLDRAIGRIVKALREEGLYDNSIILFSSDVSDVFGDKIQLL